MSDDVRPLGRFAKLFALLGLVLLVIVAIGIVRLAFIVDKEKAGKEVAQAGQAAEQADKKDLAAEVKKVCDAGGEPAKKLGTLCTKAKEIIQEPTKVVENGLTEAQVRKIVEEEVARRNLVLTPSQVNTVATVAASKVPKPANGKTPTNAQLQPLVSAAVATFCANSACVGKDGADAPPVTAEQLTATLTAYCSSRNDCVGDDGTNGTNGVNGNGIDAVTTTQGPDGVKVTMTFTDGREPVSFTVLNGKDGGQGPIGPAGPTCPEGSTLQKKAVVTTEEPLGLLVAVCVMTEQE